MPTPKYPLKPLLEHRARQVDEATSELGRAIHAREVAEDAKLRAEATKEEVASQHAKLRSEEGEALDRGELTVADLARADAWAVAAAEEMSRLDQAVTTSSTRARDASAEESERRSQLAKSMADRDVVAKDETRFVERMKKKALLSEEEAAEEAYRGGSKR